MKILLLLSFISFNAFAKISCSDSLHIASSGSIMHLEKPKIDGNLFKRSVEIYIELKDLYKLSLTKPEVDSILSEISTEKGDKVLASIKKNNCSFFDELDKKIQAGESRWKDFLKNFVSKDIEIINETIVRDTSNLQYFSNAKEIEKYAKEFVSKHFEIERALGKKDEDIKKDFNQLFVVPKKKLLDHKHSQYNNITKSFFLAMDPHSDYIPEELASSFETSLAANLQGVGLALKEHALGASIEKIIKNSPAEKSGQFKTKDIVTKVDGVSLANMQVSDIINLIKGEKGSKVKLTVSRFEKDSKKTKAFEVVLTRAIIEVEESRVSFKTVDENNKRILYIKIPSFYYDHEGKKSTSIDLINGYNIESKKGKIDGIILDLRNNGGGLLDESIRVSGLFIKKPVAVQVKSSEIGIRRFVSAESPLVIKEPLVVLINRYSASASEIVAGALKDYDRALIVGDDRTFGKGTVQMVVSKFRDFKQGLFKVTTGQFFTPAGYSTQLKGVESHVVIPSGTQLFQIGEASMKFPLDWNKVSAVVEGSRPPVISKIQNISKERVIKNEMFKKYMSLESYLAYEKQEKIKNEENDEEDFNLEKDIILKETVNITHDFIKMNVNELSYR